MIHFPSSVAHSHFRLFNFRAIPSEVSVTFGSCGIKFLEHVQVKVNLDFARRGDLYLELEAPTRTKSPLTRQRPTDNLTRRTNLTDWVFTTLFNWGESPVGQWKLKLENLDFCLLYTSPSPRDA